MKDPLTEAPLAPVWHPAWRGWRGVSTHSSTKADSEETRTLAAIFAAARWCDMTALSTTIGAMQPINDIDGELAAAFGMTEDPADHEESAWVTGIGLLPDGTYIIMAKLSCGRAITANYFLVVAADHPALQLILARWKARSVTLRTHIAMLQERGMDTDVPTFAASQPAPLPDYKS